MLLLLSIIFLFLAPLIDVVTSKRDSFSSSLNGFVFVIIAMLIGLHMLPELIAAVGPMAILMMLFGLTLPVIIEKTFHNKNRVHKVVAYVAVIGLAIHTLADGIALSLHHGHEHLAISVALHRIPVGLLIWWFIKPRFGNLLAYVMLSIIASGTLFGFYFSDYVFEPLQASEISYFQAFVAGTLIHVLLHKPHNEHNASGSFITNQRAEGIGNLLGIICVFYLFSLPGYHSPDLAWLNDISETIIYLSLETAPMLLLAFIFAGLIKAFMPDSLVSWLKSGNSLTQSSKGMAVGAPLPLCSCSVIPVYHSLIKKGVPKSAAIAFLIATPEIGIDALLISLPLLGSEMTLVRLISAALLAVIVALVVSYVIKEASSLTSEPGEEEIHLKPFKEKFSGGMHYATHDLLDHIAPWIIIGILIAALIHPILGDLHLSSVPNSLQVILFAAIGIPVYVCASSATPLVAIFLVGGISPGAALAFLLAGPATNITTFGILTKLHNRQTALLLAVSCFSTAIMLGLAVNLILDDFKPINLLAGEHEFYWLHWSSLSLLLLMFSYSIYRRGMRAFLTELVPHQYDSGTCKHHHH